MNTNSTISQVIDNIDNRLACMRCGTTIQEARIVMTQLPRCSLEGTMQGICGVVFSFLCPDCLYADPSAAEDVVAFFQEVRGFITDQDAWKSR